MEYWGSPKDRMFKLVKVRGKGLGYIALQDLVPGTLLVTEPPALLVFLIGGDLSSAASKDVTRQFCDKTSKERKEIMSLFNKYTDEDNVILGIFKTNAMVISSSESCLFPQICRANHACVPNCNYFWNSELNQQQLYVCKKVVRGEEITVSYLPDNLLGGSEERRRFLLDRNNFHCVCATCSQKPGISLAMDEYNRTSVVRKMGEINKLAKHVTLDLGETVAKRKYKALCLSLLGQLKKMQINVTSLYLVKNCLFSVSVLLCDEEMAVMWAKDVCRMSKTLTGRSPETREWAYTANSVPRLFRNLHQLELDVQTWSLEI